MRRHTPLTVPALCCLGLIAACDAPRLPTVNDAPGSSALDARAPATDDALLLAIGTAVNASLDAQGAAYRLDYAEWLGDSDAGAIGQVVFFNNRGNKQLGHDWVAGDPRRGGRTDITYITDQTEGAVDGLTTAQTTAAIDRAMATWDGAACSTIPLTRVSLFAPTDLGVIVLILGLGGSPVTYADVTHAGWLPAGILPNNVIGVTFTFIFVDAGGPTDIDHDGKIDVAFREILYNDRFTWRINGNIDVETVALHESGHGLSQGHFGAAFRTLSNSKLHFSPLAVMNAGYSGLQQSLSGTDLGGHCSIWAAWPNP